MWHLSCSKFASFIEANIEALNCASYPDYVRSYRLLNKDCPGVAWIEGSDNVTAFHEYVLVFVACYFSVNEANLN